MNDFIYYKNNGKYIEETNFFGTQIAELGLMALSFNAGHARLVVPETAMDLFTTELKDATRAEIEKGEMQHIKVCKIYFYDNQPQPYLVNIQEDLIEGFYPEKGDKELLIYSEQGLFKTLKCKIC